MDFYKTKSYQDFSGALVNSASKNTNLLLISVPGMSVTFYLQKFLEKEKNSDFKYIQSEGEMLSKFNILDLNFNKNDKALKTAESYFRVAKLNQKFALVLNTPFVLDSEDFQKSVIGSHIFNSYYFKVLDAELIKIFADILEVKLSNKEIVRVKTLSGGLTRIVKFLLNHKDMVNKTPTQVLEDEDFKRVFLPTSSIIEKCDEEVLSKLGIKSDGVYIGEILKNYFKDRPQVIKIDIEINSDLTFLEKGKLNSETLLKNEKLIIEESKKSGGTISKEKIADYKWVDLKEIQNYDITIYFLFR